MVRLPLTPEEIARGERLGAFLRSARGSRSALDVALHAGISPETLRKIESGRVATPAFPTIAAIACALSLSLDHLWAQITYVPEAQQTLTTQREPSASGGDPIPSSHANQTRAQRHARTRGHEDTTNRGREGAMNREHEGTLTRGRSVSLS